MAQDQVEVVVPFREWRQLTNADASSLSVQLSEGRVVLRRGDTTAPTGEQPGMTMEAGETLLDTPMDKFAGGSSGDRVWAYGAHFQGSRVTVSHA